LTNKLPLFSKMIACKLFLLAHILGYTCIQVKTKHNNTRIVAFHISISRISYWLKLF